MRTDTHAPTNFDPADYRVIDYIDNKPPDYGAVYLAMTSGGRDSRAAEQACKQMREAYEARIFKYFPDWRTGGTDHQSIHQCNHCGHPGIRWVAVVEHIPTGAKLAFGEICAERCELPGVDAFKVKYLKTHAQKEEARIAKEAAKAQWLADNPVVATFLAEVDREETAWRSWNEEHSMLPGKNPHRSAHPFLSDMIFTLNKYGSLTEKQVAAVEKFAARAAEFKARDEERKANEVTPEAPVVEGRREIVGEIVHTKWQSSEYGDSLKMLIIEDDGNKVWGTVPEAVWSIMNKQGKTTNDLKGQRIKLTAKVERSRDDEHFGFYKRPTKAELVTEVAA